MKGDSLHGYDDSLPCYMWLSLFWNVLWNVLDCSWLIPHGSVVLEHSVSHSALFSRFPLFCQGVGKTVENSNFLGTWPCGCGYSFLDGFFSHYFNCQCFLRVLYKYNCSHSPISLLCCLNYTFFLTLHYLLLSLLFTWYCYNWWLLWGKWFLRVS